MTLTDKLKEFASEAFKHVCAAKFVYYLETSSIEKKAKEENANGYRLFSQFLLRVTPIVAATAAMGPIGTIYTFSILAPETVIEVYLGWKLAGNKSEEDEGKPWQHSALGDD